MNEIKTVYEWLKRRSGEQVESPEIFLTRAI